MLCICGNTAVSPRQWGILIDFTPEVKGKYIDSESQPTLFPVLLRFVGITKKYCSLYNVGRLSKSLICRLRRVSQDPEGQEEEIQSLTCIFIL